MFAWMHGLRSGVYLVAVQGCVSLVFGYFLRCVEKEFGYFVPSFLPSKDT
jgi:hypothetical protein